VSGRAGDTGGAVVVDDPRDGSRAVPRLASLPSADTRWRSPTVLGGAVFAVAVVGVLISGSTFAVYEATLIAIYAIVAVAQEWLFGRAGLVSLGPAAIMAVGAFTTARLSTQGWGVFPVPLVVSFVFGAVIGMVIGVPGLRFRGLYLMLTTLALQFVISFSAQAYQGPIGAGFTVTPPHWGSVQLDSPRVLFVICVVVLGLVMLLLDGMYRGRPGRAWGSLRQNDAAASVLGVNLVRWKLAAFVGSSAITAVAGSLYAYLVLQVDYTTYSLTLSLTLVVIVFIGGIGTIAGPVLGAMVVVLLPVGLQDLAGSLSSFSAVSQWLTLQGPIVADGVYGLVLLLVLLYEPGGIFGVAKRAGRFALAVPHRWTAAQQRRLDRRTEAHLPAVASSGGEAGPDATATTVPDLLDVRRLAVIYPNGARGVTDVSMGVGSGEIVAVLGRNGAGKTTMLRAIGGYLRSEHVSVSGAVTFAGKDVTGSGPRPMFERGVVLVPERDKVFTRLTVDEHLRLASRHSRIKPTAPCAFEPLERLRGVTAGMLSGGERQMLALEVAWRSSPRLLLVDELSLGLAPIVVKELMQRLRALVRERETSVIVVEQDAAAALSVADRVYLLDHGVVMWHGDSAATSARDMAGLYLGTAARS
jgi:branched-chain amino acid transport system permease protein